jgi:hypothetical protein
MVISLTVRKPKNSGPGNMRKAGSLRSKHFQLTINPIYHE